MSRGMTDGWTTTLFRNMVTSIGATRKARGWSHEDAGIERYVGLEHLDSNCLQISRWGNPQDVGENSDVREFEPGDIIFARRRIYQRKVGLATFRGACSGHALVFRAKPDVVYPGFLPFFMQSELMMQRLSRLSAGSLSPTVNWTAIAREEFALPSLDEQRRIAAMLTKADVLRRSAAELRDQARFLLHAAYKEVFEDAKVPKRPLGKVAEVLMGRQRSPKHEDGEHMVRYLRAANIKDGWLDLADIKRMNFTPKEQSRYQLQPGDIIVTEGCGSLDEIGANACWREQVPGPVCFQNTVIRLRARPGQVDAELLRHWASYAFQAGVFARAARGTSIFHIGASRCAGIQTRIPQGVSAVQILENLRGIERALATCVDRADIANAVFDSAVEAVLGTES